MNYHFGSHVGVMYCLRTRTRLCVVTNRLRTVEAALTYGPRSTLVHPCEYYRDVPRTPIAFLYDPTRIRK